MKLALRRLLFVIAAMLAASVGAPALAQTPTTVTGSIDVVQPVLVVAKLTDLSFGTVVRPTAGSGTISIDATSGNITTSSGITTIGSSASRASFTITGQPSANIQITYPSSFNLTRSAGTETLSVSLTSTTGGGQIGGGGTTTFGMGGQLTLSNSTVSGAYTGTYTVTVAYN
jgi:hypothetical protein